MVPTETQPADSLTVDQALQQAITYHKGGQLQEAERLYRAILQTQSNHPDANHNLGVLAVQLKQPTDGLPYFKAALEANPDQCQYWLSYIEALIQTNQLEAAGQLLKQGRERGLEGEMVEALAERLQLPKSISSAHSVTNVATNQNTGGSGQINRNQLRVAETKARRVNNKTTQFPQKQGSETPQLLLEPTSKEKERLVAMFDQSRYKEAEALARMLTERFPGHGFGWKALGVVLKALGRIVESIEPMQKAVALSPNDVDVHFNLGASLNDLGRLDEAEACYRQALRIKPDDFGAHNNLGIILQDLGQFEKAEACYRRALEINKDFAEAHSNLGAILKNLGRLDEAEASYRRALVIKPDFAKAHSNLGAILKDFGRLDEALKHYREALAVSQSLLSAQQGICNVLRRMVPQWHVPMMNEQRRSNAYFTALKSAIKPDSEVFEIGTGSGLLAMMSAKLGAKRVTTCEAVPLIAETARRIVADNGYANSVKVISKRSVNVELGDVLSEKADILVSEIFSSELLGENVIPSIEDAKRRLLKPQGRVIPAVGSIMVALFGGEDIRRNLVVEDCFEFNMQFFNSIIPQKCPIVRNDLNIEMLSDGMEAFRFDFENDSFFPSQSRELRIPIKSSGRCYGVIQWIRLQMDREVVFENHPSEKSTVSNWQHCAYILPEAIDVNPGQIAVVSASHDRIVPWFFFDRIEPASRSLGPDPQDINSLLSLFAERRYTEMEIIAQSLTVSFPHHGIGWKALGVVFKQTGRIADAIEPMQKAVELLPRDFEVHNNLGLALKDMGRLDESVVSYRRALEIKPDYAESHSNLGLTLQVLGRLNEAEMSFRRALEIKPDYTEALNNIALLFYEQGRFMEALNIIKQSLQIKEMGEAKSIFIACVKRLCFTHDDSELRVAMVRALTEPWGRPGELVRTGIELIKINPEIEGGIARAADAWPVQLPAQDLFGTNGLSTLATDTLLCALLNSAPICDIETERFLTMARHVLLEDASGMNDSDCKFVKSLTFYSALACQCFINEYVFSHTDDEIQKAGELRDTLVKALEAKIQVPTLWIVAVAAYFPLCALPFSGRLFDTQWPEAVTAVLVQQILEPEEELQLSAAISRLTDIEDVVSLLVQNQYEENPYPRWVNVTHAGKSKNLVGYLCQQFPLASFERYSKSENIDVLIAGCGTGQNAIETTLRYQGANTLAIDLSIRSLSYAKRKTREMGLSSIEYAQADLLKLGSLGRSFDCITTSGVLHHLADPWAGWRVLLSLLRPGGFMKLGFYSEVARRNIVKARAVIAEQGYGSSADEIRSCRQDLVELDKRLDFGTTLKLSDFFSISACRDLLFHVQEHRMTLASIDAFLRENNLVFLGFEIDDDVLRAYKMLFPDDVAATNLYQWQIFENENPDTFIGMYQFWIQK